MVEARGVEASLSKLIYSIAPAAGLMVEVA
jgi:hypothetical protein